MHHTHFIVYVCDVHAVEDVILEVVPQYPPQDIEGDIGSDGGEREAINDCAAEGRAHEDGFV